MNVQPLIAVAGSSKAHPDPKQAEEIALQLGKEIVKQNALLVFGVEHSHNHLPDIVYEGVRKANGTALGIYKSIDEKNASEYESVIPVVTAMNRAAGWEAVIVLSADVLIVIGGGAGTLQEMAIASQVGIPIIAIRGTGGWADKLADKFLDYRRTTKVHAVENPEEAVKLALQLTKKK